MFQRDVQTGGTSLYHPREAGGCPDVMNEGIPSFRIWGGMVVEEDIINTGSEEKDGVSVSRGTYISESKRASLD